ncbi:MAG TPA: response regulator [Syntrophales bacterium]|nr:response regulator [Syntrophales bacterium]
MDKRNVLLVEDEIQMRRFLKVALESDGYRFAEAGTAGEGLSLTASNNPDVVLLDLGLPDMDGLEFIRRVRDWSRVPIIVISAREQESDKVRALDSGADDYLTKPFGVSELLARVRVAIRHAEARAGGREESVFEAGDLRIDFTKRQVFVGSAEVHLTPLEYRLLLVLARNAGKVVTHRQLLKEVWGPSYVEHTQYLRVYMTQLRHKLESDPARPRYLLNEPGVGYRFRDEPGP